VLRVHDKEDLVGLEAGGDEDDREPVLVERKILHLERLGERTPDALSHDHLAVRLDVGDGGECLDGPLLVQVLETRMPDLVQGDDPLLGAGVGEPRVVPASLVVDVGDEALRHGVDLVDVEHDHHHPHLGRSLVGERAPEGGAGRARERGADQQDQGQREAGASELSRHGSSNVTDER